MAVFPMTAKRKPRFSRVLKPKGWEGIMEMSENPLALRLFSTLCLACDHLNAVVVGVDLLAELLDCHPRSVRRAACWLEERGHIAVAKVGTSNCYIINGEEVLHCLDDQKEYVAIASQALARKDKTLRRRLTHLIEKRKEGRLTGK